MSDENMEIEESFAEMLEKSIKTLNTGEKVTGVVTGITPTEIYVDLGTKHAGYIPVSELTDDPTVKVEDLVKVGDEIETYVMRVNDQEGVVTLSKKRLDTVKSWDDIEQARRSTPPLRVWSPRRTRAASLCHVKGVRVFVPASQTGLPRETPDEPSCSSRRSACASPRSTAPAAVWWAPSAPLSRRGARRQGRRGLGQHRGGQALYRHCEEPDLLRRFCGHRRRGRYGPHL